MNKEAGDLHLPPRALLQLLADGELHSGQELADVLGVSRTAIWKQLAKLEPLGLELRSQSGKGYCLAGGLDLLDAEAIRPILNNKSSHVELLILDGIDSTNAFLMRRPPQVSLVACLAEYQNAGRGRRGRSWVSPFARNIYLSLQMSVESGIGALEGLSLAVAVGTVDALESLGIQGIQLKWPNDLLWQGRKLGGILIEVTGDPSGVCRVVVGLGLNVGSDKTMQDSIDQPWVSLSDLTKEKLQRNEIAAALLNELVPLLTGYEAMGFAGYRQRWEALNAHAGAKVDLHIGAQVVSGRFNGVNETGALILEDASGEHIFHGGEISLRQVV